MAGPASSTSPRLSGRTTSRRSSSPQSIGGPASAAGCCESRSPAGRSPGSGGPTAPRPFAPRPPGNAAVVPIAMLSGRAAPGQDGVADYTSHLVDALRDAGTDVEAVAVDPGPLGAARAARRVRALRPELVHLQFAPSAFGFSPWIGLLPDAVGAPVVTTLHEYGWWSAPGWVPSSVWTPLERRWPSTARPGGSPRRPPPWSRRTPGTPRRCARRSAGRRSPIPLAPNVPDCGPVGRAAPSARGSGCPADAQVVAFFGFVHPVKGLRYLIEAVARLRTAPPAPAPAPARRLHLARPARPTRPRAFREELVGRAADVRRRRPRDDHRPPARPPRSRPPCTPPTSPRSRSPRAPRRRAARCSSAFAHGLPTLVTAADPPDPRAGRRRARWSSPTGSATPTRSSDRSPGCSTTPPCGAGSPRAAARWPSYRTWPRIAAAPPGALRDRAERRTCRLTTCRAARPPRRRPARRHRRPGDGAAVAARAGHAGTRAPRCGCSPTRPAPRCSTPTRPSPRCAPAQKGARARGRRRRAGAQAARPRRQHHPLRRHRRARSSDGCRAASPTCGAARRPTSRWRTATTASSPRRGSCAAATRRHGST